MTPHERAQFVSDLLDDAIKNEYDAFAERLVALDKREDMAEVVSCLAGVTVYLMGFLTQDPGMLVTDVRQQLHLTAEVEEDEDARRS